MSTSCYSSKYFYPFIQLKNTKSAKSNAKNTNLFYLRCIVIICLFSAATLCGSLAYILLYNSEYSSATTQYSSLAKHALELASIRTKLKRQGGEVLAKIYGNLNPSKETWPNATIPGFQDITSPLIEMTYSLSVSGSPIVLPSQVHSFETFAYDYIAANPNEYTPNSGISSFGKGIYGIDFSLNNGDYRYHDTTGITTYDSPNIILDPVLQAGNVKVNYKAVMYNSHSDMNRGRAIDRMLNCTLYYGYQGNCAVLTDFIQLVQSSSTSTIPAAILFYPIYPVNNKDTVVGFTSVVFIWENILQSIVEDTVKSIHAVITSSSGETYTYELNNGLITYKGPGAQYDHNLDRYKKSRILELSSIGEDDSSEMIYTLTLYPSQETFDSYLTNTPLYACIGAVLIILLTASVFMCYDYFIKQDIQEKQIILETKRRYVRFISHEIRTPMNIVVMGLKILEKELKSCYGNIFNSNDHDLIPTLANLITKDYKEKNYNSKVADLIVSEGTTNTQLSISYLNLLRKIESCQLLINHNNNNSSSNSNTSSNNNTANTSNNNINNDNRKNNINDNSNNINTEKDPIHSIKFEYIEQKLLEWNDLVQDILINSADAVEVLNDLLNYDKIEDGNLVLDLSLIDPWQLIENVCNKFKLQAIERNLVLNILINNNEDVTTIFPNLEESQLDEHLLDITAKSNKSNNIKLLGDITRLSQVLRNFISNSLKFTPEGGSITVTATWNQVLKDEFQLPTSTLVSNPKYMDQKHQQQPQQLVLPIEIDVDEYPNIARYQPTLAMGALVVTVQDTGAGLSEEQLIKIFGEGVQFNANDLQAGQGSGLGLFISAGIVKLHGGKIHVESEGIGKGTTFTLILPLVYVTNNDNNNDNNNDMMKKQTITKNTSISSSLSTQQDDAKTITSLSLQQSHIIQQQPLEQQQQPRYLMYKTTKRILIVDDAATNRKMVTRYLAKNGHIVEQACDGLEALSKYQESLQDTDVEQGNNRYYDVILMDFEMPNMDGPTATSILRELGCKSLIIGLTGNALPQDIKYFKSKGVQDVVIKPLKLEELENIWNKY